MTPIAWFGIVCLIAIVVCMACSAVAAYRRSFWLGAFSLAGMVFVIFTFLAVQNIITYQSLMQSRQDSYPVYEPIKDQTYRG